MRRDPVLAVTIRRIGACGMASRLLTDHLTTLVRAIVGQQLSSKAAATIFGRLRALFPDGQITVDGLQALDDAALRGVGLSSQKLAYLRDLSARIADGRLLLGRARRAVGRAGDRAADGGQGIRPVDRRDVPDVPAAAARRPAGRRPRHLHGRSADLSTAATAEAEAVDRRSARRGGRIGRLRAGICGRA